MDSVQVHVVLTEVMEFLIQENNVMTKMWLMEMDAVVLDKWTQVILVVDSVQVHALLTEVMEFLIQESNEMIKILLMGMAAVIPDRSRLDTLEVDLVLAPELLIEEMGYKKSEKLEMTLILIMVMGVITCVKLNLIMNVLELDQLLVILFVVTVLLIQVKNVMMET